jgi:hypothetical protein
MRVLHWSDCAARTGSAIPSAGHCTVRPAVAEAKTMGVTPESITSLMSAGGCRCLPGAAAHDRMPGADDPGWIASDSGTVLNKRPILALELCRWSSRVVGAIAGCLFGLVA